MKHSEKMAHLTDQRPVGIELEIGSKKTGKEEWHIKHKHPTIAYSLLYIRMDQNKPLGDAVSLMISYQKQFLSTGKTYLTYKLGLGPAYIEKRFNSISNPANHAISSRLNYTLSGNISFVWEIHPAFSINAGAGLIHFSNGAMKVPNLGLNLPCLNVGIGFKPGNNEEIHEYQSAGEHKKATESIAILAGGFKQISPIGGPSYYASSFSYYINRVITHRSAINAGTDLFLDPSVKSKLENIGQKNRKAYYFKSGITIGHEYIINKASVVTQLGYYLFNPVHGQKFYQRAQLKYQIEKSTFLSVSLKTHLGQAEYVEWGIGRKF